MKGCINENNYVDEAERVIKELGDPKRKGRYYFNLTTTKIRNILSLVTQLYNEVIHEPGEELSQEIIQKIQYLRLRIVYEAGRESAVKTFVEKSNLLSEIKKIGNKKSRFLLFVNYIEALVAYHRFYGGNDK